MSVNKGSGAGGKNTNKNGLNFEKISDSIPKLLDDGFIQKELSISKKSKKSKNKFSFYLEKIISNKTIIFLTKNGLKEYIAILEFQRIGNMENIFGSIPKLVEINWYKN
jgi:hypothetical protein